MKNAFKLAFVGLAMAFVGCLGFKTPAKALIAEKKMAEDVIFVENQDPIPECTVTIGKTEHGTVTTDVAEGKIGDICTVTAKHDILYKIASVTANGTSLVEDENTSGVFRFALVAGENVIAAKFVVDEELCKDLTTIVEQVGNEDWENLFTFKNAMTVVSWLLNGSLVIAIVRYAVKNKKLEKKFEESINGVIERTVVPEIKAKVTESVSAIIEPIFKQTVQDNAETRRAMAIFAKCMALSQDNSPEAKKAVLDELMTLTLSDKSTIDEVKAYIDQRFEEQKKAREAALEAVADIKKTAEEENAAEEIEVEETAYDGTSI